MSSILGILIESSKLYSLILVKVASTLDQGHRDSKKQPLVLQLFSKFSEDFDENQCVVETCWYDEPYNPIMSVWFSKENPTQVILQEEKRERGARKKLNKWTKLNLHWFVLQLSVKLSMMIDTSELYSLILVWFVMTFIQGYSWFRNPIFS